MIVRELKIQPTPGFVTGERYCHWHPLRPIFAIVGVYSLGLRRSDVPACYVRGVVARTRKSYISGRMGPLIATLRRALLSID